MEKSKNLDEILKSVGSDKPISGKFKSGYYYMTNIAHDTIMGLTTLGALYLEQPMASYLGIWSGLVQLATIATGLVGMTYGHIQFNASQKGLVIEKSP